MSYHTQDLADCMEVMWDLMKKYVPEDVLEQLKNDHAAINEIDEYGAAGPVGIGLGKMGGHAIG